MSGRKNCRLGGAHLVAILVIGATPSAARADYWSDVANSGRCVSGCDVTLPAPPSNFRSSNYGPVPGYAPSTLSVNYQGFLDVVSTFQRLTPIVDRFRAMAAPSSLSEYDVRVTWFYESAYREEDRLVQALDRIRALLATQRTLSGKAAAAADFYRKQVPALEQQLEPIRQRANAVNREKYRWKNIVDRTRAAEKAWSKSAYQARGDVLGVIQAVAPPGLLRVTDASLAAAESLAPQSRTRPIQNFPPQPPVLAAPFASETAKWYPVDRPLPINLTSPSSAKIEKLRNLAVQMQNTARAFDQVFAEFKVARTQASTAMSDRDTLQSRVEILKANIAGYAELATSAAQDLLQEKAEYQIARDQMMLRAIQTWVWTQAREEIVIPKAKEFLIQNGFGAVAAKLHVDGLVEGIQAVRALSWQDVSHIRGADEFIAVQQKILGLLDPTKSAILQSAQFNALANTKEADIFSHELFGRLGEDGEELITSAGHANLPGPYQGLAAKLLRN